MLNVLFAQGVGCFVQYLLVYFRHFKVKKLGEIMFKFCKIFKHYLMLVMLLVYNLKQICKSYKFIFHDFMEKYYFIREYGLLGWKIPKSDQFFLLLMGLLECWKSVT